MTYRYDKDLEFLGKLKPEDLNDLAYCLAHDNDGKPLHTENLTLSAGYYPDHDQHWQTIAAEIQYLGADLLAKGGCDGQGILYKDILTNVCKELQIDYDEFSSTKAIESKLLANILSKALKKAPLEKLKDVAQKTGIPDNKNISRDASIIVSRIIARAGDFESYRILLTIVDAILQALMGGDSSRADDAASIETAKILGPLGWAINRLLAVAAPACRTTIIPGLMLISVLRRKHEARADA
ncbi:MAG: DUF3944 domain-containing protein [Azoarcus sp.]|nr:DUF3944 domain-containing protein [Azoarcus sp.]